MRELLERIRKEIMLPADIEEEIDEYLAKPEAKPVEYQYQSEDGEWHSFMSEQHYKNTVADGWKIRALYTHPPAQQKPLSDDEIRQILIANGFKVQDGLTDLKPYVYNAIRAIEQAHGIK